MAAGHSSVSDTPSALAVSQLTSVLAEKKRPVDRLWRLSLVLIYVLSTSLCLWFNFGIEHVEVSFIGDPGGYTEEADLCLRFGKMSSLLGQIGLSGTVAPAQAAELVSLTQTRLPDLRMNGPVFPLLIASIFALAGTDPGTRGWHIGNWYVTVSAHCFLVGLNCLLIALVGRKLWNRKVGFTAGLIAALYPGFIINSARLTTETFATTLMLALILLICKMRHSNHPWISGFSMGGLLVVSQLTRSVLVLQWFSLMPTSLIKLQRGFILKVAAAMIIGAIVFTAPWLAWQDARFGQPKPLLDRAGVFNLYVGNDPDRQGWLSMPPLPPPEITRWSNKDVLVHSYKANPSKFLRLQFDKPPRMIKTLWNDFRTPIGPITYPWQVLWHQMLLTLAVVGCILSIYIGRNDPRLIPRLLLFEMLGMHAVYFVFAPVARYNHTAMPEIILLASAAIITTCGLLSRAQRNVRAAVAVTFAVLSLPVLIRADHWDWLYRLTEGLGCNGTAGIIIAVKLVGLVTFIGLLMFASRLLLLPRLSRWVAVMLGLLLFPFLVLPLRTYGRIEERRIDLNAENSVCERHVRIAADDLRVYRNGQPYIAIDAQGLDFVNNNIQVFVNGKLVTTGAIPGAALLDAGHYGEIPPIYNYRDCIFAAFSASTGISNTCLRQWFYLPVDAGVLAEKGGAVDIVVKGKRSAAANAKNELFATQRSLRGFWSLPSFTVYSFDKAFYGSETDDGLTDARFDDHIPVGVADAGTKLTPNVFLLVAPPVSLVPERQKFALLQSASLGDVTLSGTGRVTAVCKMKNIPQPGLDDILCLRLKGQVRCESSIKPGIDVLLDMYKTEQSPVQWYVCPYSPRFLPATREWKSFDVMIPVSRRSFFDKALRGFNINLNAIGYPGQCQNIYPVSDGITQFKNFKAELYRAPGNPIDKGFRVF
jgi:hypothetical protein